MKQYDRYHTFWGSENGKKTIVCDLPIDHFVNILNWIRPGNTESKGSYSPGLIAFFDEEAKVRVVEQFAQGLPYPVKENGLWKLVDKA